MLRYKSCWPLALLLATAGAPNPLRAADFGAAIPDYGGSIKDSPSAAIAVPAPIPIPISRSTWYFRFDAGLGVIDEPTITEDGYVYGENDGPGPIHGPAYDLEVQSSWFDGDFDTFSTFGGGVGYDFGGGFRIDATVEKRSNDQARFKGEDAYLSHGYNCCGDYHPVDTDNDGKPDLQTNVTVRDKTEIDGTIWMLNGYYDLFSHRGFTPYVGAGVGFVWNQINRRHEDTVTQCSLNSYPSCAHQTAISSTTAETFGDTVSFAAAAMAGVSYRIDDITSIDIGYRYLFLGGTDVSLDIGGDHSVLDIGDQHVHQIRAGLRFDVF